MPLPPLTRESNHADSVPTVSVQMRDKKWHSVRSAVANITVPCVEFSIAAAFVSIVPVDGARPPPANVRRCGMTVRGRRNPASCPTPVLGAIGLV